MGTPSVSDPFLYEMVILLTDQILLRSQRETLSDTTTNMFVINAKGIIFAIKKEKAQEEGKNEDEQQKRKKFS